MLAEAEIYFDYFYQSFVENEALLCPITASCVVEVEVESLPPSKSNLSVSKLMSYISGKCRNPKHVIEIWHGTAYGDCKVISLHSGGVFEMVSTTYVYIYIYIYFKCK